MPRLIRKFYHLVLNGGTITRPRSFNNSRINRGSVQIGAYNLMGFFVGIGKPAGNLRLLNACRIRGKGKGNHPLIPRLFLHFGKIYGSSIHSRWCSCFETLHSDSQLFQAVRQMNRRLQPVWAGMGNCLSTQASRIQIGSGTQNDRTAFINHARKNTNAGYSSFSFFVLCILCKKLADLSLFDGKMVLIFQNLPHASGIFRLIGLRAQRMNCRPLGNIQHFGLNEGFINIFSHLPAEGIHLSDEMALGRSSDIGITGHQRDAVRAYCKNNGFKPHSRTGQSRLAARMSRTDHTNIHPFHDLRHFMFQLLLFLLLFLFILVFLLFWLIRRLIHRSFASAFHRLGNRTEGLF